MFSWQLAYSYTCRGLGGNGTGPVDPVQSEGGAGFEASGFVIDAELSPSRGWDQPGRPRVEVDLFGNERTPDGPKYRRKRTLSAC